MQSTGESSAGTAQSGEAPSLMGDEASLENAAIVVQSVSPSVSLIPSGPDSAPISPDVDSALVYLASLPSVASRKTARASLVRVARTLNIADGIGDDGKQYESWLRVPWTRLTGKETTWIQAALVAANAPNTARVTMAMVRGVLRQAFRLGHITGDQYHRAVDTGTVKGKALETGRALKKEEVAALREHVSSLPNPYGAMVWVVFACGLGAGLRREEISGLHEDCLDANGRLIVHGKGNKWRAQPLPPDVRLAIDHWRTERAKLGLESKGLLVQLARNGQLKDAPVAPEAVWRIVHDIGQDAGLEHFSPHDLRRTYCTRMLEQGDLLQVSGLMGHASVATTQRYDKRGEEDRAKIVDKYDEWNGGNRLDGAEEVVAKAKTAPPEPVRDVAWLQAQARALSERGFSPQQISEAFAKSKITKTGKQKITSADVRLLLR